MLKQQAAESELPLFRCSEESDGVDSSSSLKSAFNLKLTNVVGFLLLPVLLTAQLAFRSTTSNIPEMNKLGMWVYIVESSDLR